MSLRTEDRQRLDAALARHGVDRRIAAEATSVRDLVLRIRREFLTRQRQTRERR